MSTLVVVVVLAAAAGHASWNALAKHAPSPRDAVVVINSSVAILGLVGLLVVGWPPGLAAAYAVGSSLIHVFYNFLLGSSLAEGDLGQVYPLARGVAPLLVTLGALVLGHESLSLTQALGVLVVATGIATVAHPRPGASRRPVGLALATGVAIAGYSLVDGLGVRQSPDPLRYAALLFLLEGGAVTVIAAPRLRARPPRARSVWLGVLAGGLSFVTYVAVLWAQQRAPLGAVSALRETSVVMAALAGIALGEGDLVWRLGAAVLVASGVSLLLCASVH